MCEMLGFSSQHKENIGDSLREFFSHCHAHPNGWGLADFDGNEIRIYTEPVTADMSKVLPQLLEKDTDFQTAFAHIRKATVGSVCSENCHPFVKEDAWGRKWTLMHNGTVFSGTQLISYQEKQIGSTDSERILLYLIDQINAETERNDGTLNSFERFKVVERVIDELSYRNKLNLIIYDGRQMYVHVNMKDTLFYKTTEHGVMFATAALDDEAWSPVPLTTLLVYQEGKLKYRGKDHHKEYIDTLGTLPERYEYTI